MGTVKHIFLPEEAQFLATTFPAFTKVNGTYLPISGLAYDAAADEFAFWKFKAQNYAASGNLTVNLIWYADNASSGDVVWDAAIAAVTPNTDEVDLEAANVDTVNSVTDSHLGTAAQRPHVCTITITNLDSLAADDIVWLRISRDANNAADTMANDAILLLAELTYSDT